MHVGSLKQTNLLFYFTAGKGGVTRAKADTGAHCRFYARNVVFVILACTWDKLIKYDRCSWTETVQGLHSLRIYGYVGYPVPRIKLFLVGSMNSFFRKDILSFSRRESESSPSPLRDDASHLSGVHELDRDTSKPLETRSTTRSPWRVFNLMIVPYFMNADFLFLLLQRVYGCTR